MEKKPKKNTEAILVQSLRSTHKVVQVEHERELILGITLRWPLRYQGGHKNTKGIQCELLHSPNRIKKT